MGSPPQAVEVSSNVCRITSPPCAYTCASNDIGYLPCGCRPNLPCTALAVRPSAEKSAHQTSITTPPSCPVDCSAVVPGGALWMLITTPAPFVASRLLITSPRLFGIMYCCPLAAL